MWINDSIIQSTPKYFKFPTSLMMTDLNWNWNRMANGRSFRLNRDKIQLKANMLRHYFLKISHIPHRSSKSVCVSAVPLPIIAVFQWPQLFCYPWPLSPQSKCLKSLLRMSFLCLLHCKGMVFQIPCGLASLCFFLLLIHRG